MTRVQLVPDATTTARLAIDLASTTPTYYLPADLVGDRATYDPTLSLLRYRIAPEPGLSRVELTKLGPVVPLSNRIAGERFLVQADIVPDSWGMTLDAELDEPGLVSLYVATITPPT